MSWYEFFRVYVYDTVFMKFEIKLTNFRFFEIVSFINFQMCSKLLCNVLHQIDSLAEAGCRVGLGWVL